MPRRNTVLGWCATFTLVLVVVPSFRDGVAIASTSTNVCVCSACLCGWASFAPLGLKFLCRHSFPTAHAAYVFSVPRKGELSCGYGFLEFRYDFLLDNIIFCVTISRPFGAWTQLRRMQPHQYKAFYQAQFLSSRRLRSATGRRSTQPYEVHCLRVLRESDLCSARY